MRSKQQLLNQQRTWAESVGLDVDDRGYLNSVEANLFQPLSDKTRQSFEEGSGSELQDTHTRPAKMKALHSSSALAVNFFDYWLNRDCRVLLSALGIAPAPINITFEKQYPTGLTGNPPNLDVALEFADGKVVGIESKYTEWLIPKPKSKPPFKEKYFPVDVTLWKDRGLQNCQQLAEKMYDKKVYFRHLDVPQLLKHVLGMATQLGGQFSLYYLYYDCDGPESDVHRQEIEKFEDLVGNEIRFSVNTYQNVFSTFEKLDVDQKYLGYLRSRYLPV